MKIALAQLNPIVGDIVGNIGKVREAFQKAVDQGAELVLCPELAVCGYPPKDLLMRNGFALACQRAVEKLAWEIPTNLGLLIGYPQLDGEYLYNAASLLMGGKVVSTIRKQLLPNYDVFDERRYFIPGEGNQPIEFKGLKLGVHICEDAWYGSTDTFYHASPCPLRDPVEQLAHQGVDVFINLSASPFERNKLARRREIMHRHVSRWQKPFIFCNQVGGNDDLVFDGCSFVLNEHGDCCELLTGFAEEIRVVDLESMRNTKRCTSNLLVSPVEAHSISELYGALVLGLRDYMLKSGFKECVLGLSGGIDSAVAACLAVEAVGKKHVHGVLMPSRYSSEHSVEDARTLAQNLGIDWQIIPIDEIHQAYEQTAVVCQDLKSQPHGLTEQNLQARIRGALVMIRSNRHGWIALATGNKSELAVGYCTLYGDMAGGFAVLADVYKKDVYALAEYYNSIYGDIIPRSTIHKAPSAELAPNQFDHETLPPYPVLDEILEGLIDCEQSVQELSERFDPQIVMWVTTRMDRNEFKRRQMAPGIKLSRKAFGTGRRMPMAAKIFYGE